MNGFEMILPFLKPIEHLILDDSISEVMVNGSKRVFIEKQGYLQQVPGVSIGDKSLMVAVKNIARRLGDDISESKPILDSRLPDGSRVAAVIPPCSLGGVTLTIRKFNTRHFEMEDLIRTGALDRALANRLEDYVLARKNILISGGTGTGKTTLLSIVGQFITPDERVLLIEDTAEIQLGQENLVRFEARREQNGLPAVAIRDLLKAALSAPTRPHRPRRDSRRRSLRSSPALKHRTLGHVINNPCKLREAGSRPLHELRIAKWSGVALPRNQDQHCRLVECRRSGGAPTRTQIHFRSSGDKWIRPRCRPVRLRCRFPR
jgi:Type II/IV secretion system protein